MWASAAITAASRTLLTGALASAICAAAVCAAAVCALAAIGSSKGPFASTCPHRGAPLGEGRIEEGVLICPNHEWRFELKDGQCPQNPELKTEVYPVKIHEGKIYVRLEKPKTEAVAGSASSVLPSDLKFSVPTIQKPRNPDEEL